MWPGCIPIVLSFFSKFPIVLIGFKLFQICFNSSKIQIIQNVQRRNGETKRNDGKTNILNCSTHFLCEEYNFV